MWRSSNPILAKDDAFEQFYGARSAVKSEYATVQGVVQKTGILVMLTVVVGTASYFLMPATTSILWISCLASMLVCVGIGFTLAGKPKLAMVMAPIYAVSEGLFLGVFTAALENVLANMKAAPPGGLAIQAFIITIAATLGMLLLYTTKIIKPTRTFQAVVGTLVAGIMITYLLSWVLAIFGAQIPFLSLGSAMQGGKAAWIGIGLNGFILVVASLTLIMDFKMVEDRLAGGTAPKYIEWFCGFALLVTIAWIYYEAVKMAFRIAAAMRR